MANVFDVCVHNCMFEGGEHHKRSRFRTTVKGMQRLEDKVCRNIEGKCDRTGLEHKTLSPDVGEFGYFKFNTGGEA
eukprot:15412321-Heterocapsa_arctica.AAC.1